MRRLQALGLVVVGVIGGAGMVALGSRTEAQGQVVQSMEELNQRFSIGSEIASRKGGELPHFFRFIKDRQTGDCYVIYRAAHSDGPRQFLKTDDNACDGL